jgi:sugar phosphate isomerase/epimerase
VPFTYLVVHLGTPDGQTASGNDNQPDAARRSVEEMVASPATAGVRVALEVMPNKLSSATAICHLIEEELDGLDVGICLDYGHANLMGDLSDAIEARQRATCGRRTCMTTTGAKTITASRLPAASAGTARSWRRRRSATTAC